MSPRLLSLKWFSNLLYGMKKALPTVIRPRMSILGQSAKSIELTFDKSLVIRAPTIVFKSTQSGLWLNPDTTDITQLEDKFVDEQERIRRGRRQHVPFWLLLAHKRAHRSSALLKAEHFKNKKKRRSCSGCPCSSKCK